MAEQAALTCARCGGANLAGAANCQWCGATLPPPEAPLPSASLPLLYNPPSRDYVAEAAEEDGQGELERLRQDDADEEESASSTWVWLRVGLFVVVLVIILAIGFSQSPQATSNNNTPISSGPSYPVNVTFIHLNSSDNACGLNGATEPGFHGVTSAFSGETWEITGPAGGCTINSVTALTNGFQIIENFYGPQTISAGQTEPIQVSFDMQGLGGPYTGPLVLSVT